MSIDSDSFDEMFSSLEPVQADEFEEPPIRSAPIEPPVRRAVVEPPVRKEEPPPTQREIEAAMADELLKIAAEEELDRKNVQKNQRSKDTFLIFCPKGCRIRVKEQHRGRTGKCPRCQSEFVVPKKGPGAES